MKSANLILQKEKRYALKTIKNKSSEISNLENANDSLHETIDNAAILKASSVEAQAYKLKSDKKRFTTRAKRANAIDVCIRLSENPLTEKGNKDIYIQIVSPQGNVVADKGEIVFGENSLIYSKKEIFNFDNENLEICAAIIADEEDQPFKKGYYFVNVFHDNVNLGSTSIQLK